MPIASPSLYETKNRISQEAAHEKLRGKVYPSESNKIENNGGGEGNFSPLFFC